MAAEQLTLGHCARWCLTARDSDTAIPPWALGVEGRAVCVSQAVLQLQIEMQALQLLPAHQGFTSHVRNKHVQSYITGPERCCQSKHSLKSIRQQH